MKKGTPWNEYEVSLLIESFNRVREGRAKRNEEVSRLSNALRWRWSLLNNSVTSRYRNINGISMRMSEIEEIFGWKAGITHSSGLFRKMVNIYENDRECFQNVLSQAKAELIELSKSGFRKWLNKKNNYTTDLRIHDLDSIVEFVRDHPETGVCILDIADEYYLGLLKHRMEVDNVFRSLYLNETKRIIGTLELYMNYVKQTRSRFLTDETQEQRENTANKSNNKKASDELREAIIRVLKETKEPMSLREIWRTILQKNYAILESIDGQNTIKKKLNEIMLDKGIIDGKVLVSSYHDQKSETVYYLAIKEHEKRKHQKELKNTETMMARNRDSLQSEFIRDKDNRGEWRTSGDSFYWWLRDEQNLPDRTCQHYVISIIDAESYAKRNKLSSAYLFFDSIDEIKKAIDVLLLNTKFLEYDRERFNCFPVAAKMLFEWYAWRESSNNSLNDLKEVKLLQKQETNMQQKEHNEDNGYLFESDQKTDALLNEKTINSKVNLYYDDEKQQFIQENTPIYNEQFFKHITSLNNKEFALRLTKCLFDLVSLDENDLKNLCDTSYCRNYFKSDYAILKKININDSIKKQIRFSGQNRYYSDIFKYSKNYYVVTSQFYGKNPDATHKNNRDPFCEWVKKRIANNGLQQLEEIKEDHIKGKSERKTVLEGEKRQKSIAYDYVFYHYFNADDTKTDEMQNYLVEDGNSLSGLYAILSSVTIDGNAVDFVFTIDESHYYEFLLDYMKTLTFCAEEVAKIVTKTNNGENKRKIQVFSDLDIALNETSLFTLRFLVDKELSANEKISIQNRVSSFSIKDNRFVFEILFSDDVQQEIDDIENPKEYVTNGQLRLFDSNSICYFGQERSFISLVSAKSLKELFYSFGSHGLFASNLRFFISSKKIDPKIINTIQKEGENFCYYNNGIIITCDDYTIVDGEIRFRNFSIVNGGQTTNLIGRTAFDSDFAVICKVIKNKYDTVEKREVFLSKVAEASNTQKPINSKDLIANRPEQRLLKIQFEQAGMFLKVKRGEKIDKKSYPETWQNATNDDVAQMLNSIVYQNPGTSKNSKSKVLEDEKTYNRVFGEKYSNPFLVSVQKIKVEYNEWVKDLKKKEKGASIILGLAKNCNLMCFAVVGLLYKIEVNQQLKQYMVNINDNMLVNTNFEMRGLLQQNDIGQSSFLNQNKNDFAIHEQMLRLFQMIFDKIIKPSFELFKKSYPNYSYSHFTKSDTYYYNYVIPQSVKIIKEEETMLIQLMEPFLLDKVSYDLSITEEKFMSYKPGLEEELVEYRRRVYHESNKTVQAYEVFSNKQLAYIVSYLPKNKEELLKIVRMKKDQIEKYGDQILKIILKYSDYKSMV